MVLADDLGSADVGFNGCTDIPTPNIDALARQGVRCSNGYVSHPFCSPTRAGLLTGRYQQRFGHENNPTYDPADQSLGLPTDQTTLAQVLRASGYVTGAVGKWHLGTAPGSTRIGAVSTSTSASSAAAMPICPVRPEAANIRARSCETPSR